ncbi:cysteine desulfurase sulfur acceptor subunit CsdE [Vibrio caribbeanicus]|uniref:cysteine desulfurase sulfur acceptor subunit CsdE n=1 Tax=Vibrio caribbeanicus TaxID=701175 RepID=UPI0030D6D178
MIHIPPTPFGTQISVQDIVSTMQNFHGWEDRYRQVIQWGKKLPIMPEELKSERVLVSGCESMVWLVGQCQEGKWYFCADSDARIVRGLIALVLAAFNGKSTQDIRAFDVETYFENIGLLAHLSPSRGNGLRAIVDQIKQIIS